MSLKDIDQVIDGYAGLSRKTLDYCRLMKRLVDDAKKPVGSAGSSALLAQMVAVDDFERIGNFKEVMDWNSYIRFLGNWASTCDWDCSFRRITETANLVFLELEERSTTGGFRSVVNSMSVYAFNRDGKIHHLDIYLQMELPRSEMLASYEGIRIST